MKATAIDMRACFAPVVGQKPWCARLGVGSIFSLDFGPKVQDEGRYFGAWNLWVFYCDWRLETDDHTIVTSDSDRHLIKSAITDLEAQRFESFDYDSESFETTFTFERMRLICLPPPPGTYEGEDSEYWMWFMPDKQVLRVGPADLIVLKPSDRA